MISVLIVDDSQVSCDLISHMLQKDPSIHIIGTVNDGKKALKFIQKQKPDVILMDIHMPNMDGFEATRLIMQTHPIPIVICSGNYKAHDVSKSFEAIDAGALAILEKPCSLDDPAFADFAKDYIHTIKTIAEVKLITRYPSKGSFESHANLQTIKTFPCKQKIEAVGIGASLGGPQALKAIFSKLSKFFPVPIFVVQHISTGFTEGLASWLQTITSLQVVIPKDGEKAQAGYIYIFPNEKQIRILPCNIIRLIEEKGEGFNPSISSLFKAMLEVYQSNCLSIILTGMGKDGVDELLKMKQKGAITIAQSKDECIMFGMPREAIQNGAATHVVALSEMASFLNYLLNKLTLT